MSDWLKSLEPGSAIEILHDRQWKRGRFRKQNPNKTWGVTIGKMYAIAWSVDELRPIEEAI